VPNFRSAVAMSTHLTLETDRHLEIDPVPSLSRSTNENWKSRVGPLLDQIRM
jgi:hypothetical protein